MIVVYGVIGNDADKSHIDVSKTLRGAKIVATRNGYTQVSKRIGYNATIVAEKKEGKWIEVSN